MTILGELDQLIRTLVELTLRRLGLWSTVTGVPVDVNVTIVWEIEVWWEREFVRVVDRTRLSEAAAATLHTALGRLVDDLEQASASGGTPAQIRDRVLRFRERWQGWSRTVATTESTRIASEAVLASPEARRPGALKEWVTSHDERVRHAHRLADGQRVPVAGSFVVGESLLRYPGDPLGNPLEVINCRCYLRIVFGRTP